MLAGLFINDKIFLNLKKNIFFTDLGLLIIIASIIFHSNLAYYPSLITLVPVIGTFFIIVSENKNSFSYKFLSNRVFVFLGSFSYSTYVLYFPIFVLSKYLLFDKFNFYIPIIIGFIFLASYIVSKTIEKPFYNPKAISDKLFITLFTILTVIIVLIGFFFNKTTFKSELNKSIILS